MINIYRRENKFTFIGEQGMEPFAVLHCSRPHDVDASRNLLIIPGVVGSDPEFTASAALLSARSRYFGLDLTQPIPHEPPPDEDLSYDGIKAKRKRKK